MKNVSGSFKKEFLSSFQDLNRTAAENKSILEQSLTIFIKKYEQVLVRSYKNLQESLFCKQSDIFLRNETINMEVENEKELTSFLEKLYESGLKEKFNEITCAKEIVHVALKHFAEHFSDIDFYEKTQAYLRSNLLKPISKIKQSSATLEYETLIICQIENSDFIPKYRYRLQIALLLEIITVKYSEKSTEEVLEEECRQIVRMVESICFREPSEDFQALLKTVIENYGSIIPQYIAFIFEEIGQPVPEKLLTLSSSPNTLLSDLSPPHSSSTIGSETALFSDQFVGSHDSSKKVFHNPKRSFTAASHHLVKLPSAKLSRSQSARLNKTTTPKKRVLHNSQSYKTPPRRGQVLKTKSVKETPLRKQKSGSVKRQERSLLVATPEAKRIKCIEESPILGDETKRNLLEKRFSAPTNLSKRQLFSPVKTSNQFDIPQMQEPAKRIENIRRTRNIVI